MDNQKQPLTRADIERIIREERRRRNRDNATAIVDAIERTPVVREITIGIVSVLSLFR